MKKLWLGSALALSLGGCDDPGDSSPDTDGLMGSGALPDGGNDPDDDSGAATTTMADGGTANDPGNGTTGGGTTGSADTSADPDTGSADSSSGGGMPEPIYEEIDGILSIEAEHADAIDNNGTEREWYIYNEQEQPLIEPDPDPPHWDSASGSACLEGLPDTRVTHDDPLVSGVSFYGQGGDGPILRYRVWINNPGRFWVRVRAYSTGSEDNGIHVGLDGSWPDSGERIQWCAGKNQWTWSGAQRTDANHCGEENMIFLDIDTVGEHEIAFSMREDGFEMDKWMLTNDPDVFPEDEGPDESPYVD